MKVNATGEVVLIRRALPLMPIWDWPKEAPRVLLLASLNVMFVTEKTVMQFPLLHDFPSSHVPVVHVGLHAPQLGFPGPPGLLDSH